MVAEIDSNGRLVELDPHSELPPKPEPMQDQVEKPARGSRPVASEVPPLEQLVTLEHYQLIKELAESYKTTLNAHPKQNVLLGQSTRKVPCCCY